MKLEINIEKRLAFAIIGLLIVAGGLLGVIAFNTNNPEVFGHSIGEVKYGARNIEPWGIGEQSGPCDQFYDEFIASGGFSSETPTQYGIPSVDFVCASGWAKYADYSTTAGDCENCGLTLAPCSSGPPNPTSCPNVNSKCCIDSYEGGVWWVGNTDAPGLREIEMGKHKFCFLTGVTITGSSSWRNPGCGIRTDANGVWYLVAGYSGDGAQCNARCVD